jgi:hypothetical protein
LIFDPADGETPGRCERAAAGLAAIGIDQTWRFDTRR